MKIEDGSESEVQSASRGASFLERLAETLGGQAHAQVVYGEPIERGGLTVIPVAKARWAFGGGGGRKAGDEGSGGGGGVMVSPIGYIEVKDGESRFRPIHDPVMRLPSIIAGG